MTAVVGLDPSLSSFGAAWLVRNNLLKTVAIQHPAGPARYPWRRQEKIYSDLVWHIDPQSYKERRLERVVLGIEGYAYGFGIKKRQSSPYSAGEARGIALRLASAMCADVVIVSPKQAKLFLTGDANADKSQMVQAANDLMGLNLLKSHDDQADAAAVLCIVSELYGAWHPLRDHMTGEMRRALDNLEIP